MRNIAALCVSASPIAFAAGFMPTDPATVRQIREQGGNASGGTMVADVMLRRSADSAWMLDYWDQTDAIVEGLSALRRGGEKYLPRFSGEENADYQARLQSTKLTNVYRDIVESLAAKPFEQEVTVDKSEDVEPPEEILGFVEDVDGSGSNLTLFAGATFFGGINSAISWIFVDRPPMPENVRNRADEKAAKLRPYWSHVIGRNVLDVQSAMVNGEEMLTYIRIFEPGSPDQVRIFRREPNGAIIWELRTKGDAWIDVEGGKTQFAPSDGGTLAIDVIPMVPFFTGRRDGRRWRFHPAMRDAADLQIELYQQESALKWNKMLGAYSMLTGNGVSPPKIAGTDQIQKIATGPGRVLYAPPNGQGQHGEWTFIQPDASVMKFLSDDNRDTISQLRELGRQPLTAQSGNLTVITTAVAAGKAKSAVAAWALLLKNALENAMVITCKFEGIAADTYDPVVSVFTEFDEFLEGKDLPELRAMRDKGDISQETYWHELRRRRVLSDEFDPEQEVKRLRDEALRDTPDEGAEDVPTIPGAAVPQNPAV